jgi:hypothetical protein
LIEPRTFSWSQRELYKKQRISWKNWQTTYIALHNDLFILRSGEGDNQSCEKYLPVISQ